MNAQPDPPTPLELQLAAASDLDDCVQKVIDRARIELALHSRAAAEFFGAVHLADLSREHDHATVARALVLKHRIQLLKSLEVLCA